MLGLKKYIFKFLGTRALVHSAMPKSASRYLSLLLQQSFPEIGYPIYTKITPGYGHNFVDKKILKMRNWRRRFHIYGHIPLTNYNLSIFDLLDPNFAAIVVIRNLPDVVVSYVDHALAKGTGPIDMRINGLTVMHRGFNKLPQEIQYQAVIDHIMPWYSQYIASWLNTSEERDILFLRYEDVVLRPRETLKAISEYLSKTQITTIFQYNVNLKTEINLNKGVSGRGRILTCKQHQQLLRQAQIFRCYKRGLEFFDYLTHIDQVNKIAFPLNQISPR